MDETLFINGTNVHIAYIALNCLWVFSSLVVGAVLLTQVYRVSVLTRSAKNPRKFHGLRVQWAHATGVWVCMFIAGIDVSHIYFDESFFFGLLFGEIVVLLLNMYIFYFFSHVEAYIISHKSLDIPEWLPRTRFYWLVINFIVGNLLNVATYVLQRASLYYLVHAWAGVQAFCVACVLGAVAWRLTQTVAQVFGKAKTEEGKALDSLRKFKVTSVISVLIGLFYGVALTTTFVLNVLSLDLELHFDDVQDTKMTREMADEFTFYWLQWTVFVAIVYAVKLFWIPKSVFVAAQQSLRASAYTNSGGNKVSGGGPGNSKTAAAVDPFASPYKKSLYSSSPPLRPAAASATTPRSMVAASSSSGGGGSQSPESDPATGPDGFAFSHLHAASGRFSSPLMPRHSLDVRRMQSDSQGEREYIDRARALGFSSPRAGRGSSAYSAASEQSSRRAAAPSVGSDSLHPHSPSSVHGTSLSESSSRNPDSPSVSPASEPLDSV